MPDRNPPSTAFGRREFLAAATQVPLHLLIGSSVSLAHEQLTSVDTAQVPDPWAAAGQVSHGQRHAPLSKVNIMSAHAVSTGFLGALGTAVVLNAGHISLQYAAFVNALETGRLAALACGESPDRTVAKHEIGHLLKDSLPALIMIAASDFAERGIALEPSVIAGRLDIAEDLTLPEDERLAAARPGFSKENQASWQAHLAAVSERIGDRAAQMVAITSIAAPCATTLTSSAFWKDGFDDVAHLCMELALCRQVLECIKRGAEPGEHLTELKALAASDATEMLNGSWGYNQLGVALACNAQGLFGVGTPPNIWFAANHLSRDPLGCAVSEVKGLLLSETQTLLATGVWLSRCTGQGFFETCSELIANQYHMLGLIRKSFSEAELRSTSIGDGGRLVARLVPILHRRQDLQSIDQVMDAIREEIKKTPRPAFQLSLGEWLERMGGVYERIQRRFPLMRDRIGNIPNLSAEELDDIDQLRSGDFYRSLRASIDEDNAGAVHGHLEKYQRWRQNRLSQRIAVVLHTIAGGEGGHEGDLDDFIRGFGLTSEVQFDRNSFPVLTPENTRAVAGELAILSKTLQQLTSFSSSQQQLSSAEKLYAEGSDIDGILRQLGYVHRHTVKQACDMLVSIGVPLENVLQFLKLPAEEASISGGNSDSSPPLHSGNLAIRLLHWLKDSWEDPRNLSESTRDIIRVIATQLPAIPAFSITLSELLKQFARVEDNAPVSREQLSSILRVLPVLGFSVAALADNVPGYLILEEVMIGLFRQTFSAEALARVPSLNTRLGFVSKILASQSGMTLPFSSATNLLQDKVEVIPTDAPEYPQGFGIKRTKLSTGDTTSSWFMRFAAGGTIAFATLELNRLFSEATAHELKLASSEKRPDRVVF